MQDSFNSLLPSFFQLGTSPYVSAFWRGLPCTAHGDDCLLLAFPSISALVVRDTCSHVFVVIFRRSPPGLGSDHVLSAPVFGIDLFCLLTEDYYSFLLTVDTIILILLTIFDYQLIIFYEIPMLPYPFRTLCPDSYDLPTPVRVEQTACPLVIAQQPRYGFNRPKPNLICLIMMCTHPPRRLP